MTTMIVRLGIEVVRGAVNAPSARAHRIAAAARLSKTLCDGVSPRTELTVLDGP